MQPWVIKLFIAVLIGANSIGQGIKTKTIFTVKKPFETPLKSWQVNINIPRDTEIIVLDYVPYSKRMKVKYNERILYISRTFIKETDEILGLVKKRTAELIEATLWVKELETKLYKKASAQSQSIITLRRGDVVYEQNTLDKFVEVITTSNMRGWMKLGDLSKSPKKKISDAEYRREKFISMNPNLSPKYAQAIKSGLVKLGMAKDMVIASIGTPDKINKTVNSIGQHEQWVYKNQYIYFDNGSLTAWQQLH